MVIGVAVGNQAIGPFTDILGKPLVTEHCEGGDINPTIVTDDEKQTYLTWGVQELWHVKLNKDMISYDPGIGIAQVPAEKRNWFAAEIRNTVNGTEKRSTTL